MGKTFSPFVYWAQSEEEILLRVDLKNTVDPNINIEEEEIEFAAVGTGSQGEGVNYHFVLEFFLPVQKDSGSLEVNDREVRIKLKKKESDWWPRLVYAHQKLPWLKVDFDRIKNESDTEEEKDELKRDLSYQDILRTKYPEAYEKLQKEEFGFVSESKRRIYLFCYNIFMFCGFLYAFLVLTLNYSKNPDEFVPKAFETVGGIFKFLQLLMILEILNPLFGYTKGSVYEATIQVGGRLIFLFLLIDSEPRMQDKPVVFYLLMTYSSVEIVRYPYYLFRVYDMDIGLITWLRYTIWIPLYPIGFICEGVIALRNIPYFEETEQFSVLLPNRWNFAFYFPNLIRFYLLFGFFPLLYTQMWHMYQLRCKRLGIKQHKSNKIIEKDD
ncbi:very-long-chain (3R)-3-hydroxyacyl-CoA dehydratase [Eurytemora carolleeae]|uniref:very-long-chain (3R)-3-hydroxyacyl-CoA dehydratase n=1 Tax=Eurytemora carolleeae TaxID=1294199 RepID=UPI000C75C935|nr:very-long-chain (3R)-3-hydroxyacyl-CoA dehydratase [Eurytemora carolleeae]XP_023336939.1 very-long-chain (3R)-3-hydroxyacyl-CoA dehydratase [Eurytemora carolleeae]|eukprot:XP_023336938.1 very-long-chain (3R)-3-hydroxyacyl-CoA dehydratase-like [Eurytemora affinis]